ncbi:hypothetical protein APHAL10511_003007 [Amanita phalloides]|nr:hypothetical protein APHAL10511_003007 [Amanita phalloides]
MDEQKHEHVVEADPVIRIAGRTLTARFSSIGYSVEIILNDPLPAFEVSSLTLHYLYLADPGEYSLTSAARIGPDIAYLPFWTGDMIIKGKLKYYVQPTGGITGRVKLRDL